MSSSSRRELDRRQGPETRAAKRARLELLNASSSRFSSPPLSPQASVLRELPHLPPFSQTSNLVTSLPALAFVPSSPPASPRACSPVNQDVASALSVNPTNAETSCGLSVVHDPETNQPGVPPRLDALRAAPAVTDVSVSDKRPAPSGSPPLWSRTRQGFIETVTWMRSMQSSAYTKNGLLHGVYLGRPPSPRGAMLGGVIITVMKAPSFQP